MRRLGDAGGVPAAGVKRDAVLWANYPDNARPFIGNLMEIAASEAAVERFFSQLKRNIGDRRERTTATAAVSQVPFVA
jgi:hypothetical protein